MDYWTTEDTTTDKVLSQEHALLWVANARAAVDLEPTDNSAAIRILKAELAKRKEFVEQEIVSVDQRCWKSYQSNCHCVQESDKQMA